MTDTSWREIVEHHTPTFSAAFSIDLTDEEIPALIGLDESETAMPWSLSIETRSEETARAKDSMVNSRMSRDLLGRASRVLLPNSADKQTTSRAVGGCPL